jgi:hypothetical protein
MGLEINSISKSGKVSGCDICAHCVFQANIDVEQREDQKKLVSFSWTYSTWMGKVGTVGS